MIALAQATADTSDGRLALQTVAPVRATEATRDQSQPQEPDGNLIGVRIVATGSYVPEKIIRNRDLVRIGCDEHWIEQRTGIHARRHAAAGQSTSDLAYEAARRCLMAGGLSPQELDMIIVSTATPDLLVPSTAAVLQGRLGSGAATMDVNAACSGFLYAINTSAQFLKTGACRNILVIAAEIMSRKIDPRDAQTYPLFGDGAGAVLMDFERGDRNGLVSGILAQRLGACGELAHLIRMPLGSSSADAASEPPRIDQYIRMEGRSVFKWAVTMAPAAVGMALDKAGLTVADIDLLIFHQANRRIMECAARTLNIQPEKVFMNIDRYGNTSSASIPLALDEATASGRIKAGDRIVLCGFGAGLTWGVCVYQVGNSPPTAGPHAGG